MCRSVFRILSAVLIGLLLATASDAAVRRVKSGVVSLSFSGGFVSGLILGEIDSPAEPAEGFDLGLLVVPDSTFSINVGDGEFAGFRDGRLDVLGGISYLIPNLPASVDFGEFSIIWDAEREPEEFYLFGRFEIQPVFDLLLPLGDFAAGKVVYDDATGQLVAADIDIVTSMEFAEAIGFPPLAGTPMGRLRIDLRMAVPNGDADGDTDVDLDDYAAYADCVSGPSGGLAENICATFDFDDDGDVDLIDWAALQNGFTGTLFTLDVRSDVAPDVAIDVTPTDYFGQGGGEVPFLLSFEPGTDVTLTAPPETLLTDFVRWRVDDTDFPDDENVLALTLETPTTATAVYVSVTSELMVTSTGPAGVPIVVSQTDVFGDSDGNTDFVRVYHDGTELSLTAPTEAGDQFFSEWVVDGQAGAFLQDVTTVVVSEDVTADAVYAYILLLEDPQSMGTCVGQSINLSVTAAGNNLSYQWKKDGVVLDGETSDTLTIELASMEDSGAYTVEVSNANASVTSAEALVAVVGATPIITGQPSGADVCPGGAVFMFAGASGGVLDFQWSKDGVTIDGATSAFFSISPAMPSDSGVYTVEVSNQCGSVVSNDAIIDVDEVHCP